MIDFFISVLYNLIITILFWKEIYENKVLKMLLSVLLGTILLSSMTAVTAMLQEIRSLRKISIPMYSKMPTEQEQCGFASAD